MLVVVGNRQALVVREHFEGQAAQCVLGTRSMLQAASPRTSMPAAGFICWAADETRPHQDMDGLAVQGALGQQGSLRGTNEVQVARAVLALHLHLAQLVQQLGHLRTCRIERLSWMLVSTTAAQVTAVCLAHACCRCNNL